MQNDKKIRLGRCRRETEVPASDVNAFVVSVQILNHHRRPGDASFGHSGCLGLTAGEGKEAMGRTGVAIGNQVGPTMAAAEMRG